MSAAPPVLAAVDLGSNSFRMEVGRVVGDQIYPVDSLREPVRLASGLTGDKTLEPDATARGLQAIERFGERLRGFEPRQVRAVATNTLRVARNAAQFLRGAEQRLGFPIEVIGGREEARLIYYGVAHLLQPGAGRRLVVDIGGGSTELIVGTGRSPEITESVYVGCVGHSLRFFADGYEKGAFKQAELAARREIEPIAKEMRTSGWTEAIGSSGTARALADLLEQNGFSASGLTREGLERLKAALVRAGRPSQLALAGLRPDRVPVLPGGLAIMLAVFAELSLDQMSVSDGALRTGVLYDLLGRSLQADMREATVQQFMRRHDVDRVQAEHVAALACSLWGALAIGLSLPQQESVARLLRWAALLHEIGLAISHNGYHKHSAYIVANADMPGFSKREQDWLANLVLGHTGKLAKMRGAIESKEDWAAVLCLRLATTLHRSRNDAPLPLMILTEGRRSYELRVPQQWLRSNPLTEYDLRQEVEEWRRLGRTLEITPT